MALPGIEDSNYADHIVILQTESHLILPRQHCTEVLNSTIQPRMKCRRRSLIETLKSSLILWQK